MAELAEVELEDETAGLAPVGEWSSLAEVQSAMRNALLPTITIVALDVGYLLGGIIVVEEIFAIPGIGRQVIVAITSRDLPSIQAAAVIMAATYAIVNTLSDIAYSVVDKRIRYD